jgi:hypothetical protein
MGTEDGKMQRGEWWGFLCYVFFCALFLLTIIGFFVTRKGPSTHVIVYLIFLKYWIDIKKAEELSYISSHRTLTTDKNRPSLYTLSGAHKKVVAHIMRP